MKDYGATGNGVTDDTTAIQAAMAAIPLAGGILYFPTGIYIISSVLDFSTRTSIVIQGEGSGYPATLITGAISGSDIVRYVGGGCIYVNGINLTNSSVSGRSALYVGGGVGRPTVERCQISCAGSYGIYAPESVFSFKISSCRFDGVNHNGIGIMVGGHTTIQACDIVGWAEGARIFGACISVLAGRFEVNDKALVIGLDSTGASSYLSRSSISGNAFEGNGIGIDITAVYATVFQGMGMQGSATATPSRIGILCNAVSDCTFSGITVGGGFSDAAIRLNSGQRNAWINVSAGNDTAGKKTWDVRQGLDGLSFHNCNYIVRPDDGILLADLQLNGSFQALSAIDYLNPSAQGRNLRGKNVAVTQTAVSKAIAFIGAVTGTLNTATATTGGSLAAGTYYYVGSIITSRGECGVSGEKTVVVGGANNAVDIAFFGIGASGFKRRVYRGTVSGIYDGYYETGLDAFANFLDVGAAFDGLKSPCQQQNTSMAEPDANYAVIVTPNWGTTVWVTAKATTGFTINFGTAAPASATVDWFIVR